MTKEVAVVILNWNGKNFLEQFLPSVVEHNPSFSTVYVADNASTDDSLDFLKSNYPTVKTVVLNQNYGFAGGYNRALKQIKADYYVLLNSDVEVSENWLNPMMELMEKDTSIGACQPKIKDYNRKEYFEYAGAAGGYIDKYGYPFCQGRVFDSLEQDHGQYNETKEVFWASGACMCVKADLYHQWKV